MGFVWDEPGRLVDADRGLEVVIASGYKNGAWSGWVRSSGWEFKVRVYRENDRYPKDSPQGLSIEEWTEWIRARENPEWRVKLSVGVPLAKGAWDRPETMLELAKEIAVAREILDDCTEPWRIIVNE